MGLIRRGCARRGHPPGVSHKGRDSDLADQALTTGGAEAPRGSDPTDRPGRMSPWLAVLFGIVTYILFSVRATLNPDESAHFFNEKRIIATFAGAFVFWLAARAAGRSTGGSPGEIVMAVVRVAVPGALLLFLLRTGLDLFLTPEVTDSFARSARWMLLWLGYFGAGISATIALFYQRQVKALHALDRDNARPPMANADDGVWVKTSQKTIRIPSDAIEWVEAEGNYARVHSPEATGLVRISLSALEAQLDPDAFVRVHRSAICRREAIRGVRRKPSGAMTAVMASGAEAPVGRSFGRELAAATKSRALDA